MQDACQTHAATADHAAAIEVHAADRGHAASVDGGRAASRHAAVEMAAAQHTDAEHTPAAVVAADATADESAVLMGVPKREGGRAKGEWAVHQVEHTLDYAVESCLWPHLSNGLNLQVVHQYGCADRPRGVRRPMERRMLSHDAALRLALLAHITADIRLRRMCKAASSRLYPGCGAPCRGDHNAVRCVRARVCRSLFPQVGWGHYPALSPIVRAVCDEFGVGYTTAPSFWAALRSHFAHLARINSGSHASVWVRPPGDHAPKAVLRKLHQLDPASDM